MSVQLLWLTDIHLNFVGKRGAEALGRRVAAEASHEEHPVVVITGDIGEASNYAELLAAFAEPLRCPWFFVLGNHDYYGSSIGAVRRDARRIPEYLPDCGVVSLDGAVGLVGADGFADARFGNPLTSPVRLNDFALISEFAGLRIAPRVCRMRDIGTLDAHVARWPLREAAITHGHVVFATHVPPFVEATWHEGKHSDADWLPWFSCKAMGDMLLDVAQEFPETEFTVLCGHTHGSGEYQALPNLRVLTGGAEYGDPKIDRVLEVGP